MSHPIQIGVDSQCLSYFIDAMDSKSAPSDILTSQKFALVRLFFYLPDTLWVTPSVTEECSKIRNIDRALLHQSFINVLCGEKQSNSVSEVQMRASLFTQYHSGRNDCLILAEAEDAGHDVLLSFDADFVRHLSSHAHEVELMRPTDYWERLNIPHGALPNKIPHPTNPLASQDWWRW